ncbi:RXT2-like protein [Lasiosphaeria hispida]|uniref:RXT2-like protein n=1 Tax=Lasiosphaeria hispida TaxID=260671 RepID=A0AAJ0HFR1_9PEZI|nr:RXT2-like protein [Lasiosphaeria hispida]
MSTQQQALIMETVVAIRKALKRKSYDSDSDSSIEHATNRGYKLKKRARFVKQGRLVPSAGPAAYKEIVEHAGYQRAIINENPPLIDDEGYELDSDDNEERVQEAIASAMEENPYSLIRLEQLLAPLTAVADLPAHPTLSRPFISNALTELVNQGCKLMHKENAALWKAKPLLTRLIGDNTWAPCGIMIEPSDMDLFTDTARFLKHPVNPSQIVAASTLNANESSNNLVNGNRTDLITSRSATSTSELNGSDGPARALDQVCETGQSKGKEEDAVENEEQSNAHGSKNGQPEAEAGGDPEGKAKDGLETNGNTVDGNTPADEKDVEMAAAPSAESQSGNAAKSGAVVAHSNGSRPVSTSPESLEDPFIHPLFLPPRSARTDRDLGLPEQEAEDVRRLLQLYVQKQEEVCRGTKKLYEGLLKADQYRKTVWQWAKAEAHCGANRDMSDGEDWYDKEEWGLTEDLKKGEDEVEEDTAQTQKKTRTRR